MKNAVPVVFLALPLLADTLPADDIQYIEADGPTIRAHALCPNPWRNGKKIGEEVSPSRF